MGGETAAESVAVTPPAGLSPRGRGNPVKSIIVPMYLGSIPAWAGKPGDTHKGNSLRRVYPRVGGETDVRPLLQERWDGLSPRGRGNLATRLAWADGDRSIPAWAGKPRIGIVPRALIKVYPRVGGETERHRRGYRHIRGLSPRGRGNLCPTRSTCPNYGSIPAWAGEPALLPGYACLVEVYPRVGGGTLLKLGKAGYVFGLSPRGRGNPRSPLSHPLGWRSIPAWAGEPCGGRTGRLPSRVYPRVGGGTGLVHRATPPEAGLSPRGRGNLEFVAAEGVPRRSIPAWAGEPRRRPFPRWP